MLPWLWSPRLGAFRCWAPVTHFRFRGSRGGGVAHFCAEGLLSSKRVGQTQASDCKRDTVDRADSSASRNVGVRTKMGVEGTQPLWNKIATSLNDVIPFCVRPFCFFYVGNRHKTVN
jgi:hypothetical protein